MAAVTIINSVLNGGNAPAIQEGLLVDRPAFGFANRLYLGTDTKLWYRDTGLAWETIGGGGGATPTLQQVLSAGNISSVVPTFEGGVNVGDAGVSSILELGGDGSISKANAFALDIYGNGNISNGNTTFNDGDIYTSGILTVGILTVNDTATVGSLTSNNGVEASGDLFIGGNTTLNGTLILQGLATLNGNVNLNGHVSLNGAAGKTIEYTLATSAPANTPTVLPASLVGSSSGVLGLPSAWILVVVNGTTLKMPCYL